ncbi:MAG: PilZ domain-containing protein [Candidatus Methylomirabilales bacterium]
MSEQTKTQGTPRFKAYVPVQCTALGDGRSPLKPLAGKTQWVSAVGLGLLLPETLPLGTRVLVQLHEEEPRRGQVVWVDKRMRTHLGTAVPHRVAFDEPVDPALVRRWISRAKSPAEPRVRVQLVVNFQAIETGRGGQGTCMDLSRGGMFIAANHPPQRGSEILLQFKLPDISHTLSALAQVMWVRGEETVSVEEQDISLATVTGMGVRFLTVNPVDAALMSRLVNRLRAEATSSADVSRSE